MNNIQKSMLAASVVASLALVTTLLAQNPQAPSTKSSDQITKENVDRMIEEGRQFSIRPVSNENVSDLPVGRINYPRERRLLP